MKKSFLLLGLFTLSSCAVTAKLPMSRFESPEVNGEWLKAEGQVAYQGQNEVEFTPDYVTRAPTMSQPSVEPPGHRLIANGALGLFDRFDMTLTIPKLRLGGKYQFVGNPRTTAEKGNFSFAMSAGISGSKEKDTSKTFLGIDGRSYELSETQADVAAILGWRFTDDFLLYGGPFLLVDWVKTDHVASAGAAPTTARGTIRSPGMNVGVQGSIKNVFFRGEVVGTKVKIGEVNVGRATYGLAVGAYL